MMIFPLRTEVEAVFVKLKNGDSDGCADPCKLSTAMKSEPL